MSCWAVRVFVKAFWIGKGFQAIQQLSQDYQLEVDPNALVEDLPVGIRQRVEIIKALYREADILILDEPTAVLTPQEIEGLFSVMDLLRKQGKSIIFITHKLKEVLRIADRISVLRRGKVVGEATPSEATEPGLAAMMVGREVMLQVDKQEAQPGKPVLQVKGVEARDDLGEICLRNVELQFILGRLLVLRCAREWTNRVSGSADGITRIRSGNLADRRTRPDE